MTPHISLTEIISSFFYFKKLGGIFPFLNFHPVNISFEHLTWKKLVNIFFSSFISFEIGQKPQQNLTLSKWKLELV